MDQFVFGITAALSIFSCSVLFHAVKYYFLFHNIKVMNVSIYLSTSNLGGNTHWFLHIETFEDNILWKWL